ncbi:MAG: hypothetical protein QNK05_13975 [Myxococcota bacterium]|nr:hypothetical protein [Myxococcota bacterium]
MTTRHVPDFALPFALSCCLLLGTACLSSAEETAPREAQVFTIFMLVRATDAWLALEPEARFAFLEAEVQPIIESHPEVGFRFYDSEAFTAETSDVIVWQMSDLGRYQSIVERLRETRFWGHYFAVGSIIPAIENAYAQQYDVEPFGPGRSSSGAAATAPDTAPDTTPDTN